MYDSNPSSDVMSLFATRKEKSYRHGFINLFVHYNDVIMGAIASKITSLTSVELNGLFRRRAKKTSKLRVTGLCAGNSPGTGEFPAQRASNAENVFIWWRHHARSSLRATMRQRWVTTPACHYRPPNHRPLSCRDPYQDPFHIRNILSDAISHKVFSVIELVYY